MKVDKKLSILKKAEEKKYDLIIILNDYAIINNSFTKEEILKMIPNLEENNAAFGD